MERQGVLRRLVPACGIAVALVACGAEKDGDGPGWDSSSDTTVETSWDTGSDLDSDTPSDVPVDRVVDYEEEPCVETEVSAENRQAPVDIIWVVDSSGSMDFENHQVRDNLNAFSSHITMSGVEDYHVILIGDASEMSVPPPLGGGPNFLHIDDSVGSNEGLEKLIEHYPAYKDFLRAGAVRHFVAVSDDESDMSSTEFITALGLLTDPGFPPYDWSASPYGFQFHSIVAFGTVPIIGCATGAAIGRQYLDLSDRTGGVTQQVCLRDWSPIFSALETAIGVVTLLPCVYDIPEPPEGERIHPDKVNVYYTPTGGSKMVIPRAPDASACAEYGWYYDIPAEPTQIILCPETCDIVQADTSGTVNIAFGCDTVIM
jgi:hypothetical protein